MELVAGKLFGVQQRAGRDGGGGGELKRARGGQLARDARGEREKLVRTRQVLVDQLAELLAREGRRERAALGASHRFAHTGLDEQTRVSIRGHLNR